MSEISFLGTMESLSYMVVLRALEVSACDNI